ncbi:hypothetical protein GDO81_028841 [Engystomops pustulosus]|uniref:Chromatin accessibility complex protein 1 n=1 Tax=Engystomops pustulosus TaxID=76066 RepID=A0AAV6ZG38_ENGPU|nr:hypothetical protein GDO81_028841 [Engystomops pustulosus]
MKGYKAGLCRGPGMYRQGPIIIGAAKDHGRCSPRARTLSAVDLNTRNFIVPTHKGEMAGTESRLVSLPLSRIRLIMKSSPDVSCINPDALIITAKATELFVKYLASYSYKHGTGKESNTLTYDDLSSTAEESDTFQFLSGR